MAERPTSDLTDRTAIVTGGGALAGGLGNGRAASILLAAAGADVVVVDREFDRAAVTVEMIEAEGGRAIAVAGDVTNDDDCQAIVDAATGTFGSLDILVNNVGIGSDGSVVTERPKRWEVVMNVNLMSMVAMSRAAIPSMVERAAASDHSAAVVNVSSISALRPRGMTAYSTSKGAVMSLTQAMAVDHGRDGVRVNCVAPGPVRTPMVGGDAMPPDAAEARRRASVLGIEGTGWDVGAAVRFLCSDEARYITGQTLVVDGGVTLRGPGRESG